MSEATERADALEFSDAKILVRRGLEWLRAGRPDRAIEEFDSALSHYAQDSQALFGRGRAWLEKGEFAKSLGDFDE